MIAEHFFDEWSTYEKVVANDYMHHRDFFAALADHIATEFDRPLSVVDLGCGDGQPAALLSQRFKIEKYVGIDQSIAAIDRARQLLSSLAIPFELHSATILDSLQRLDGQFDLGLASFSLHHLDPGEKQAALNECRRLLKPGALLAIVDVFLEEGESRENYVRRWENNARSAFRALTPDEADEIVEHMRSCDIPESVTSYRRFAKTAGFHSTKSLRQDTERLNRLVVIS